jgi:hypothetical protein
MALQSIGYFIQQTIQYFIEHKKPAIGYPLSDVSLDVSLIR